MIVNEQILLDLADRAAENIKSTEDLNLQSVLQFSAYAFAIGEVTAKECISYMLQAYEAGRIAGKKEMAMQSLLNAKEEDADG